MATFEESVDKAIEVAVERAVTQALSQAHPIGSIYLTLTDSNSSTLFGGTWEKVGSGKCLWLADSSHGAGTTISAGLPNITGTITPYSKYADTLQGNFAGAFYVQSSGQKGGTANDYATDSAYGFGFDASKSNSIYGSSSTVQPPAYVVIAWKRTA